MEKDIYVLCIFYIVYFNETFYRTILKNDEDENYSLYHVNFDSIVVVRDVFIVILVVNNFVVYFHELFYYDRVVEEIYVGFYDNRYHKNDLKTNIVGNEDKNFVNG